MFSGRMQFSLRRPTSLILKSFIIMTQNYSSRPASTSSKFQVIIDDQFYKNVTETIRFVLRKNAGSWISSEQIEDIASAGCIDVWMKCEQYNPEGGASFKTWYTTCAHNFAISQSKKLKRAVDRKVDITSLTGFDAGKTEIDPEKRSRSKKVDYRSDSTFGWAAQELGINLDEYSADFAFKQADDEAASLKRLAKLESFLSTRLSDKEKEMLGLQNGTDGLTVNLMTKEQLMEQMHMSDSNAYTSKHRLLSKISDFITSSEFTNDED